MIPNLKILHSLISLHPTTEKDLSRAKRQLARDFGIGIVSNNWLLQAYREAVATKKIVRAPWLENILIKRRVRTLSGVAPVTVATNPYPCPGRCVYCPTDTKMPKSYLRTQPAAARALRFKFDPYTQTQGRLKALYTNGHQPEKVELRVLGGTWSHYPTDYQINFISELYRGLNCFAEIPNSKSQIPNKFQISNSKLLTLFDLQKKNERARHRCVGLSIETRPDQINLDEIIRLRQYGVTKVEMGVQHLDQEILDLVKRDQTKDDVVRATRLLKDAGFKVCYHIMPNLPGSTPEKDIKMFKELFDDPALRPDQLKIYPCTVLRNAPLFAWYKKHIFKTYDDQTLINLIAELKKLVPPYVRIERIYRDVPTADIVDGCQQINIRQIVQQLMRERDEKCRCIRCREVRDQLYSHKAVKLYSSKALQLYSFKYDASDGEEHFLSYETADRTILFAFLRLRFPSNDAQMTLKPLINTAIIRELHTYGQLTPLTHTSYFPPATLRVAMRAGILHTPLHTQHHGLGKQLLAKAEQIARAAGYDKIAVISGVGVRGYYRKQGYRLENKFGYMIKKIKHC